ncbi:MULTISPECIES: Lrp/AsnC family transcriptional regulator [unclassified Streptomyces]|uniref:Lrp/AsnC family transcriptional regulator n=2 Tax=unclassified Streptomyces TaxID=2593676 RepID=UPI002024AD57|nr:MULTISPECIES: AsnC family transcriptional regulator [unclassified Streptomyces]WSC22809.1 AsnC family transcriptional regulator [Streptomyces sp. NBC_01766]
MESIDLQLIHALRIDGRAPLRRIASVLEVSDQLVARRYARLRETAGLRVVGRLNPRPVGQTVWALRLQCVPSASLGLARALAERDDTRWVQLASGGTEIICHLAVHGDRDRDALLMDRIPASRRVTSITAHRMLRLFKGGPTTWDGPTSALSRQQRDALAPAYPPPEAQAPPVELTDLDQILLTALTRDGRTPHAQLAAEAGCHESTVRRRIAQLRTAGALFFDLDIDESALGSPAATAMWMAVRPAQLAAAGAALAGHPEVAYAAATTGRTNLLVNVLCPDDEHLYAYLSDRIGALPGVDTVETAPVIRTLKRAGAVARNRGRSEGSRSERPGKRPGERPGGQPGGQP